jgi:hypothetical protein
MKTFGRIIIILTAFAIVMGLAYMAVKASSSAIVRGAPTFERGGEGFPRSNGETREFRGEGGERGGGWIFGLIKNIGIVAVIVALIAGPKSLREKKKRNNTVTPD